MACRRWAAAYCSGKMAQRRRCHCIRRQQLWRKLPLARTVSCLHWRVHQREDSAFNAARMLDESWETAPQGKQLQQELGALGLYEDRLTEDQLRAHWVRFDGLDLGIMPADFKRQAPHKLLCIESHLACR